MPPDRALLDLASSVADGAAVDWAGAEGVLSEGERRLIRHLRLVERIATVHRTLPEDPPIAPPDRHVAQPEGPRWARLVLLDRIGEGTSCAVYRAWDTALHRHVALKLFHDDGPQHARVLDEARRLARVRHQNVVHVYGAEEHDGRAGLWMELVTGESLEETVRTRGTFAAREAALVGLDLCAALAAVHGAGLLHRDVKAQNVMREAGGRVVLMDFGTGEDLQRDAGTARLVGTPLYLAPEVFLGQPATVRSDIYAIGVLLFYLVTGKVPVEAASVDQLARAHAAGSSRRLRDLRPELPAAFVSVVEGALERDPARRFATAGEMEAALRHAMASEAQFSATHASRRDPARASRVAGGVMVASAVLLLGLVGWGVIQGGGEGQTMRRIAVLPIADLSKPATPPYLAEGLTDQLISTLGQFDALQITPRASVMAARVSADTLQALADRLKVDGFVESTVIVSDRPGNADVVRINARLISASGAQVWSGTFDRVLGDTLALQSELARSIAGAVRAKTSAAENERMARARRIQPVAERSYFEGLYYLSKADGAQLAFDAFARAIEQDPSFASAHAGLARSYLALASAAGTISHAEARSGALAAATRAASIDPDCSEAQLALADLKFSYDWDWAAAAEAYERALDLNGSSTYARTQYARYLAARGRFEEAVAQAELGWAADPTSIDAAQALGVVRYFRRDFAGALSALDAALQLDRSRPGTHLLLARVNAARGAFSQAIEQNEHAIGLSTRPVPSWSAHLAMLKAAAGRHGEARAALAALLGRQKRREWLGPQHLAYVHMALGDSAAALDLLTQAVDERDPDVVYLAFDPRVDPLRGNPRFHELLAKIESAGGLDRAQRLP